MAATCWALLLAATLLGDGGEAKGGAPLLGVRPARGRRGGGGGGGGGGRGLVGLGLEEGPGALGE